MITCLAVRARTCRFDYWQLQEMWSCQNYPVWQRGFPMHNLVTDEGPCRYCGKAMVHLLQITAERSYVTFEEWIDGRS